MIFAIFDTHTQGCHIERNIGFSQWFDKGRVRLEPNEDVEETHGTSEEGNNGGDAGTSRYQ